MTDLVHLTPAGNARRVVRTGLAGRSPGWFGDRGVYCMPVLPSFTLTYQWVRELRRWKQSTLVGVQVRIPDDEPVTVGRYGQEPTRVSAAEAAATIRGLADPRGYEVFVPRPVAAAEVRRVRRVPQGIGWRYKPDAHGLRPCTCPACIQSGTPGAAQLRRRFPYENAPRTKPAIMADLRAATTSDDIEYALYELGMRRRGGAEELAFLADHPDPEVREALVRTLARYRGRAARELLERVQGAAPSRTGMRDRSS
ncbi:HEAT repeat domain-containing protein [Luedemannella helvata]|uniref:HEAT repeat domain-containing protein n=1 Tax=Luedemannella helvata TaxID=349315 RepID=A0ABP4VYB4_9ACTN